ncbi:helix-turn-helix domain-containing protein [Kutzneria buriramensis]|uniref:PucR-like helix-turn-helix protein n=1 Tax=Kutzneria buriramensis TaxID=1045776 RepID=A0A3E0GW51_9PSEU|nr:helix-turn-helix domain-containing protein [Kutzneria buriramensis]REH28566.1 PucR-like helix-turn-helix protein [Kutzneria buriramensis]
MTAPGSVHADQHRISIWSHVVKEFGGLTEEQHRKARETVKVAIAVYCSQVDSGASAEWDPSDEAALRTLGLSWALRRWPLDPLLDLLDKVEEQAAATLTRAVHGKPELIARRLRSLTETGNRLTRELLLGYQEARGARATKLHPTAVELLHGRPAPAATGAIALAYAVLAYRTTAPTGHTVDSHPVGPLSDDVLSALCPAGGYLLVPATDGVSAMRHCAELHKQLPSPSWAGVCWAPTEQLPQARAEAVDVVASALAFGRAPGCYRLSDVLVEYAVLAQPAVVSPTVSIIEPVANSPQMLATLQALLAADGNRTKAAADLEIHRSTLDYRLQRIEDVTGQDPTSTRGLQVLGTALTAREAAVDVAPASATDSAG